MFLNNAKENDRQAWARTVMEMGCSDTGGARG